MKSKPVALSAITWRGQRSEVKSYKRSEDKLWRVEEKGGRGEKEEEREGKGRGERRRRGREEEEERRKNKREDRKEKPVLFPDLILVGMYV